MKILVMEFLKSVGHEDELIGKGPDSQAPSQSIVTAKANSTTDNVATRTKQTSGSYIFAFENCKRLASESELPFNEQADLMAEDPGKFYEFLSEQGLAEQFTQYFEEQDAPLQEALQQLAKERALKMAEDILAKADSRLIRGVMPKTLMTIDEVKGGNHRLIVEKLEKIAGYCKENMSDDEKKVILSHFNTMVK